MREILFRGKDIHGDWHTGLLTHIGNAWYISNKAGIATAIEVIPDTIGQYIGLTDKNGKKIFEGDIIRLYGDKNNPDTKMIDYNALVIFISGRFCAVAGTKDNHYFERLIFNSYLNYEVIGNKYDNPELFEACNNNL